MWSLISVPFNLLSCGNFSLPYDIPQNMPGDAVTTVYSTSPRREKLDIQFPSTTGRFHLKNLFIVY
jgi:hypothetical protein